MDLLNPKFKAMCTDARQDPEAFWAQVAQMLPWQRPWNRVLEWTADRPDERGRYFRWYEGGITNLAWNCLDRHLQQGRGGQAALICEDERGRRTVFTYAQLHHLVRRLAAALRGLGVRPGDRVAIYMPTCAEAIALMLACTRVGAIHLVVFAGFGAGALGDRIRLAGARYVFCADTTWRKGKEIPLKDIVDHALVGTEDVEKVVVLQRGLEAPAMTSGRDLSWTQFLALADGESDAVEWVEANEPAYILATSGTTAKPKLAVHAHGPYQVYILATGSWVFGLRQGDIWWSTSDIGWVVGHSYIVYAPLLAGCTTVAFEGALDHPGPETFYRIVEENGITGIFTSPTAVRLLARYGAGSARSFDLSSLQRVMCAGEPLNPPAWEWLQKEVLKDRVPVIDHMWQTETAGPVVGNPYGLGLLPIKPGSAGVALPGIEAAVLDTDGTDCGPGEKGIFVIRRPFPGLIATLWGEPERYRSDYWERFPGQTVYFTGDAAVMDEDGYLWFSGRADEIIKIAGHRIGTIEVETALLRHPAVAEAGVIGRPDPVRMEVISAFVVPKNGYQPSDQLRQELMQTLRDELGPVAVVGEFNFVNMLPKTRSGKIMRRVLKAVVLNRDPGDISTIEDEGSVEEARAAWFALREATQP